MYSYLRKWWDFSSALQVCRLGERVGFVLCSVVPFLVSHFYCLYFVRQFNWNTTDDLALSDLSGQSISSSRAMHIIPLGYILTLYPNIVHPGIWTEQGSF